MHRSQKEKKGQHHSDAGPHGGAVKPARDWRAPEVSSGAHAFFEAARSLREEGIKVILINSNPATIMTDPMMADKVYLLPLTVESIEQILKENQIDAVLPTMGGQTALNLCKEEIGRASCRERVSSPV